MTAGSIYNFERMTVLLVEDSFYILQVMTDLLRHLGVGEVIRARDGVQGIEALKGSRDPFGDGSRIDLVISDMMMTPIDGLVLLRWVREGKDSPNRFMPFIMMSGAADDEFVARARDQGVNEFLAKPFTSATVAQRILEVIDNPRQFVATRDYFGPDRHRRRENVRDDDRRLMTEKEANVVYRRARCRGRRPLTTSTCSSCRTV